MDIRRPKTIPLFAGYVAVILWAVVSADITEDISKVNMAANGISESSKQVQTSSEDLQRMAAELDIIVGSFRIGFLKIEMNCRFESCIPLPAIRFGRGTMVTISGEMLTAAPKEIRKVNLLNAQQS